MTTTESIRDWFLECPQIKEMMNFYADYIGTETIEASIFTEPSTLNQNVDIAGNVSYEGEQTLNFTFAISAPFGSDVKQNLANLELLQEVTEWIYEKNKAKDFPEIVEGSVMSIMPKSSAHLAEASASIAIYEMPCSLLYWRYE